MDIEYENISDKQKVNYYLLNFKNEKTSFRILVDSGFPEDKEKILKELKKRDLTLKDIHGIILTHNHYDHCGCAAFLKSENPKIILIGESKEEKMVKEGKSSALTHACGVVGKQFMQYLNKENKKFESFSFDIKINKEKTYLRDIFGEKFVDPNGNYFILQTPGHIKEACITLVCKKESLVLAFTGDYVNGTESSNCFPVFYEDINLILKSWELILNEKVTLICPGHGVEISGKHLEKSLKQIKEKNQEELEKQMDEMFDKQKN